MMARELAESILSLVEGLKQPSPKSRFGTPAPPRITRSFCHFEQSEKSHTLPNYRFLLGVEMTEGQTWIPD